VSSLVLGSCDLGFVEDGGELFAAYPTCSDDAIDPDGDGWGWESARSCIVSGSGIRDDRYPTCTASATDPDGDGWGWEPAHSCIVSDGGGDGSGDGTACAYVDGSCSADGSCRVWTDYGDRAGVKAEIWDEMYRLNGGAGEAEARCRADLAVAMAMQEAHSFAVDWRGDLPYDASKDGRTDGAQNVCLFNMNIDFIKRSCRWDCGRFQSFWNQADKMYLNQRSSLRECVRRLDEGFDYFGIDGTLHFHRGGWSGWEHPGADERDFARAEKTVADHLRDHPEFRTNGARVAHRIDHR